MKWSSMLLVAAPHRMIYINLFLRVGFFLKVGTFSVTPKSHLLNNLLICPAI